jgi:hypothetical protein
MPTPSTDDGYLYIVLILFRLKSFFQGYGVFLLNSFIVNRSDIFEDIDKDVAKSVKENSDEKYQNADGRCGKVMGERVEYQFKK